MEAGFNCISREQAEMQTQRNQNTKLANLYKPVRVRDHIIMVFLGDPVDMIVFGVMSLNVVLTAVLVLIYMKNFKKIGSKFTIGLSIFALAFLIQNIASIYFYKAVLIGYNGLTTFQMAVSGLQLVGLALLLYVTWK